MSLIQFTLNIGRILTLYFLFDFFRKHFYFQFGILLFSGLCDILINFNVSIYLFFVIFFLVGIFNVLETKNVEFVIIIIYNLMLMFYYGFSKTVNRKQEFYNSVVNYLNELDNCSDETNECYICLENCKERSNLKILPCSHFYHTECILKWFSKNKSTTCPVCKQEVIIMDKIIVV